MYNEKGKAILSCIIIFFLHASSLECFGLLIFKVPFLPGSSDLDQLSKIFETLGTPSEDSWPVSNQNVK